MQKSSAIRALSQARTATSRRRTLHPRNEDSDISLNHELHVLLDINTDNESFIMKDRE
jgi:hypothetical protein